LVTVLRTTHFKLPMQYRYHILLQAIAQQAVVQALGAWPLPAIFHQPFTLLWQWQAHCSHYTTANPFYSLSARHTLSWLQAQLIACEFTDFPMSGKPANPHGVLSSVHFTRHLGLQSLPMPP